MEAERRIGGKTRSRALLRAFNGAGIGAVLGAMIGCSLGGLFACVVLGPRDWEWGAASGIPAGVFGGALIGLTMAMRNHGKAWWAAVGIGLAVGGAYSILLSRIAWSDQATISVSVLASGLLGGALVGAFLRIIRVRWGWWSRWEDSPDGSRAGV